METYQSYKGFGIRYSTLTRTTTVESAGFMLTSFPGRGESAGLILAKEYIDTF